MSEPGAKAQDQHHDVAGTPGAEKKRNGFFALDMDQFERAGTLGLEPAAAYLALMAGTDANNTASSWGINAVSGTAGLTRHEAKRAVGALVKAGLASELEAARTRARTKPRYQLPVLDRRVGLAANEQAALQAVRSGSMPETQAAHRAAKKGWIEKADGKWVEIPPSLTVAFIPNSFVRTKSGSSPLARLLNAGEIDALMLAVRLYRRQNLMESRGVPLEDISQHYRARVSQPGQHPYRFVCLEPGRIWEGDGDDSCFSLAAVSDRFDLPNEAFWAALRVLEHCHVIEWAVYTANGEPIAKYAYGRPAKPVAVVRSGVVQPAAPESSVGRLAHAIHCAHLQRGIDPASSMWHWPEQAVLRAIEHASVPHIEGIGILRMTHRAHTDNTRAWWHQISAECEKTVFFYGLVARGLGMQVPDLPD